MDTTILLIRHAAHGHLGTILSGRVPGLSLSAQGTAQARRLASRLAHTKIERLQTSPLERARQTAAALADGRSGVAVETVAALNELDFGDWAGRSFAELADDPRWQAWNRERSTAVAPNGERMAEAQARAWQHVDEVAREESGGIVAMVSHCDIIRAVVAQVLGLSLDAVLRYDVDPASITRLQVGACGARLVSLNEGAHEQQPAS